MNNGTPKALKSSRRQRLLLFTVFSMVAAQLIWAEHQAEHLTHDGYNSCAVCLYSERGNDVVVDSVSIAVKVLRTFKLELPVSGLPVAAAVFTNYRSRASP
ncbi:MAG: hypothetical protein MJA83_03060 [Gammaproteobacteria bacterium]|nr:hypothetical protein [Gammaproteobacteria bacterium]